MTKQTKPVQIGLVCFAFTRRRRTHHLHDGSFGIAQGCRPGNEGKTPPGTAYLMQKRALIAMQYSALHNRTWKTPTVQKPCKNRAETVHSWLTKQKSHEIFRSTASTVDIPNHWDPQAKQQQRVALADFSAAPWQGFEKSERGPNNSSLFQPQAAVVVVALG